MNAFSHDFDPAGVAALPRRDGLNAHAFDLAEIEVRWNALHAVATAVAELAQLGCEAEDPMIAALPERAADVQGWRRTMALQGIEDLSAVMQIGLTALLGTTDRGKDGTAAAVTLWREFHAGRQAIVDLLDSALD